MKTNLTLRSLTSLLTLLALFFTTQVFAQPANDDCANAFPVTIGADEASAVPVAGSTVDGTPSSTPDFVCSGSWFGDDIWFSFTTGATPPDNGYVVKALYGTETGDLGQAGMGLYEGCGIDEVATVCFSDAPGRVTLINPCEYLANHTYYVRVWSAPGVNDNSGALRMIVFDNPDAPPPETDNILWGANPGEGDFDGGINDWTVVNDTLNCGDTFDLWRWNPAAASLGNSCGNAVSSAPSHCNGGMAFSSDAYDSGGGPCGGGGGPCAAPQTGELVSPSIDISGFGLPAGAGISLKFWQTTRQFNSTYFVSYSNDGGTTWIDKEINTELVTNDAATDEFKYVFLKDADLNSTDFKVKFRWQANFYYWIVDDVALIETAAHDLECASNNFYAIAPNLVTPVSQVEPYSHLADIYNAGAQTQTNVNLNVKIDDGSGIVFEDNLAYDPIPGDSLVENLPMPGYFTPDGTTPGTYTGTYEIMADSMDLNPESNFQSYTFMTSDTVFAKETGGTGSFNPAASNWDDLESHGAAYGNYFYVVNGDDWHASSVDFAIATPDSAMIGRLLSIYLYSWDGDNNDPPGEMDPDERTKIAFNIYEITGNESINDLINVPLLQFPYGEPGPIDIESNQAYAVMVEYTTNDQVDFIMANSQDNDYAAMITRSGQDGLLAARYSPLVGLNDDLDLEPYGTVGFGQNTVPIVRLNIAAIVDTKDQLDPINVLKISPNPTNNKVNLRVDLVETQDNVNIRIMDINGRLIIDKHYNDFKTGQIEFDVSRFPGGTYFLHFISDDGMRTERFVVQH